MNPHMSVKPHTRSRPKRLLILIYKPLLFAHCKSISFILYIFLWEWREEIEKKKNNSEDNGKF